MSRPADSYSSEGHVAKQGGAYVGQTVPKHLLGERTSPSKKAGKWAISLVLLFVVMVSRHHGGAIANMARHQIRVWLTQNWRLPLLPANRAYQSKRPASVGGMFLPPISHGVLYQRFGWAVHGSQAQFHADIVVGTGQGSAVLSGVTGKVVKASAHFVVIDVKTGLVLTYSDLAKIVVSQGQLVQPWTAVARLDANHRMSISVADHGLPLNPLVPSCFGPEAFSQER